MTRDEQTAAIRKFLDEIRATAVKWEREVLPKLAERDVEYCAERAEGNEFERGELLGDILDGMGIDW